MENERLKNAVEFMLYTYYKLDFSSDTTKEKIFDTAIRKAYSDATNQGAYNTLVKDNAEAEKIKNEYNVKVKNTIIDKINKLNECSEFSQEIYDSWFHDTCNVLVNNYKDVKINGTDKEAFTYGNAQKIVNMTMKYLAMLIEVFSVFDENRDIVIVYGKLFDKIYKYLHSPVDSFIIEAVWNRDEEIDGIPYIYEKLNKNKPGAYSSGKYIPWSKWEDKEVYDNFKNLIFEIANKENKCPLDWEGTNWIKISKKRK